MIESLGEANTAAIFGLIGGVLLGLAARLGRFCTLGAIEDLFYGGNDLRLRMWGVAIGVAVIGSFGLSAVGHFDMTQTIYVGLETTLIASAVGGLVFGYGMALAGNCGYGALARLGGGDLRNFVIVLVMGIASYATISGPLAYARVWLFPTKVAESPSNIPSALSDASGISASTIGMAIGVTILLFTIAPARIRQSPATIFWGAVVGLAIVSGWAGTSYLAAVGFDQTPVESHTFSAPLGDAIFWWMTASGQTMNFAIGSVSGVWLGAFAGSLIKGHFRWEACEDPRELRRQIIGAGLMGVGAVVAMGCSIGQGLSAASTLAWNAPVTMAAILIGAAVGLRHLIAGFQPAD